MRLSIFVILLIPSLVFSQELVPLMTNFEQVKNRNNIAQKTTADTLDLPFLDEFSTSILTPNPLLFEPNGGTYINNRYCINPPTSNVASFDGLNTSGQPYSETNEFARGKCDELTSQQINLSGKSDVYMSFWWQAQGNAVPQVSSDSIQLSFLQSDNTWHVVWTHSGTAQEDFKFEIIPVDSSYLHEVFRFKFENFGSQAGMFSVWHVDYIYINDNRSPTDSVINDIAFSNTPSSFLKDYWTMPYWHFAENPSIYLNDSISATLNNFKDDGTGLDFVIGTSAAIIDNESGSSISIHSNTSNKIGPWEKQKRIAGSNNQFNFVSATSEALIQNRFSVNSNDQNIGDTVNNDVAEFNTTQNDTISSYTRLSYYYAYDDGSAEQAYRITTQDGMLMQEYDINVEDTLYGVSIYFPGNTYQYDSTQIILMVWDSIKVGDNYNADNILYDERVLIGVADSLNGFTHYNFLEPVIVKDKFYIGYRQDDDYDILVGYDINSSRGIEPIYFNINGSWQRFQLNDGILMMRPNFRKYQFASVLDKIGELEVTVYPNPVSEKLNFTKAVDHVIVYDITGSIVLEQHKTENYINISTLKNGMYFLNLQAEGKLKRTKFIKK